MSSQSRNLYNVHITEINTIIQEPLHVDVDTIGEFKDLFKDGEWDKVVEMAANK